MEHSRNCPTNKDLRNPCTCGVRLGRDLSQTLQHEINTAGLPPARQIEILETLGLIIDEWIETLQEEVAP
jgi:hypothetical protein